MSASAAEASEGVVELLRRSVPRDCVASVTDELKKDFVFAKKRSRRSNANRQRGKNKFISRRERRSLGLYSLPRSGLKYADVCAMHQLWCGYMSRVLELDTRTPPAPGDRNWDAFAQSVYKAELHGSMLRVVRSTCPSYVGACGVCVRDTQHTVTLLATDDRLTCVPKKQSVFEMSVRGLRLLMFGKQLCARPAERSVKKIKTQQLPDL